MYKAHNSNGTNVHVNFMYYANFDNEKSDKLPNVHHVILLYMYVTVCLLVQIISIIGLELLQNICLVTHSHTLVQAITVYGPIGVTYM